MNRIALAARLVRLARSLTAADDYEVLSEVHKDYDNLVKTYNTGNWTHGAYFPGSKRRGKRPQGTTTRPLPDLDKAVRDLKAQKVIDAQIKPDYLKLTIIGNLGTPDTYVFTKVPFEEAFGIGPAPRKKKRSLEIAMDLGQELKRLGLTNLGRRSGKAGEQWGTRDSAVRIAIGKRDLMLNYLLVERGGDNSRWNLEEIISLKEVKDKLIQDWVRMVKAAPTMKEVRALARQEGSATALQMM